MPNNLDRNEEKINGTEEKYKMILDNANDLITIINEKFVHEYINEKAYFDLLGYSKEDIIGNTPLIPLHPDDQKIAIKALRNGFKYGIGRNEMRVRHKDGHYLWLENKGKTFIDTDGKRKAIIISRDITERKNAERLIIAENKELLELSQIKSELITKASHELKTPLSSIYGASQILLSDFKDQLGENVLGFVEMIHRGSQKLKQLIENLLELPKVESGKLALNRNKENLCELIKECINDLDYLANERNINISYTLPKELNLEIDRIKFEQVINNLLSNAIKNTPPEGKIVINSKITAKWVEISFKDTGIGLIKKEKEILFQKYGKINRDIKNLNIDVDGSGLGLYISKEIVELHNGNILVKSMGRNKGSTFTIRLPHSI